MLECEELTGVMFPELTVRAEKTAERLIEKLNKLSKKIALAESCTAGLVSALLSGVPGASSVLWGSFVCYTQEAKVSMLGLNNDELNVHGLVSGETAGSMAKCALEKSGANLAAAVTGLAGPGGDGSGVPIGTVWVATASCGGKTETRKFNFKGERNSIRLHAAIAVLESAQNDLT